MNRKSAKIILKIDEPLNCRHPLRRRLHYFRQYDRVGGEELALDKNFVVENILPAAVLRKLSDAEMNVYRRPYKNPDESRRPTLTWPREIPIAGNPNDVSDIIQTYSTWLSSSQIPKLFIEAIPGAMFTSHRDFAKSWPNQTHVKIRGGHFVSEDSPDETGIAIAAWLKKL